MSQTTTAAVPQSTSTSSPEVTTKPTRDEVIDRIIAETHAAGLRYYTRGDAGDMIDQITTFAAELLDFPEDPHHLSREFLYRHHHGFSAVVPDDYVRNGFDIIPGSAHAGLNSLCLTDDQVAIEHTSSYEGATRFCDVMIYIRSA